VIPRDRNPFLVKYRHRFTPVNVTAGAIVQSAGDILTQPAVFLSAVAFLLGGTNRQIASFAVVIALCWSLASIVLAAFRLAPRQLFPVILGAGALRIVAALVFGFTGIRIEELSPARIVSNLVFSYLLYQISAAFIAQASNGLVVSSISRSAIASTMKWRGIAGAVAATVSALAVWRVFNADGQFDDALGQILIVVAIALLASTWFALNIPGGRSASGGAPTASLAKSLRYALGHSAFRKFAIFKLLLGLAAAVDPFLIIYGFQELGISVAHLGLALLAYALGHVIGFIVWPRWIRASSPRVPLQIATLLRLAMIVWVIALPTILESSEYTSRFDGPDPAMRGFAWGFALLGLASSVGNVGNQRYLTDIAPRGAVHALIMGANALAAITGLAPLGVAWLLEHYELERLLWATAGVAIAALLASGLLVESRVRVRAAPGAWRTRNNPLRVS
jgi:hypothetical protein